MIKISLGHTRDIKTGQYILIPYWFTRDGSIHLNVDKKEVKVDEKKIPKSTLIEIYNGVSYGRIIIDNKDKLTKEIESRAADNTQSEGKTKIQKSIDELKEEKEQKAFIDKTRKAKDILAKNTNDIRTIIGPYGLSEDGSLKDGIADLELLNAMLEMEQENEFPRSSVINQIEKRINAIKQSNGFMFSENEEMVELKKEDFKE